MATSLISNVIDQYNAIKSERDEVDKHYNAERAKLNQKTQEVENKLKATPNLILMSESKQLKARIVELSAQIMILKKQIAECEKYDEVINTIIRQNCNHRWLRVNNDIDKCEICGSEHYLDNES